MPFERPTPQQIIDRILSDVEVELPGADVRLRRSFERIFAKALGGLAHGLHGHLDYIAQQIFPDSADTENLERWANIYALSNGQGGLGRKPAAKSAGDLDVNATGVATVPVGTIWQRTDGVRFEQQNELNFTGLQTGTANLIAEEPGADGNTDEGTTLSLASPITNVNSDGTVEPGGTTGGTDEETDGSLIDRLLTKIRTPGDAGGPGFYVEIATAILGITRAFEMPQQLGPGTVLVIVVDDDTPSKIPSPAKVTEVQEAITAEAPITAVVTVSAPTTTEVDVSSALTLEADASFADVKARVITAITALFDSLEPGSTVYLPQIANSIQDTEGVLTHSISEPTGDVLPAIETALPILGTLTIT